MKFGGSSIRDAERVTHVADLIASKIREGFTPAVVVSAMGTTTNELERAGALALVDGIVRVDEMRKLHLEVLDELELPANVGYEVRQLLRELESLLGWREHGQGTHAANERPFRQFWRKDELSNCRRPIQGGS